MLNTITVTYKILTMTNVRSSFCSADSELELDGSIGSYEVNV